MRSDLLGLCERLENALAGGNWTTLEKIHAPDMTAFIPNLPISLINLNNAKTCEIIEAIYKIDRSGKGLEGERLVLRSKQMINSVVCACDLDPNHPPPLQIRHD